MRQSMTGLIDGGVETLDFEERSRIHRPTVPRGDTIHKTHPPVRVFQGQAGNVYSSGDKVGNGHVGST
jgi:hypothetical protein